MNADCSGVHQMQSVSKESHAGVGSASSSILGVSVTIMKANCTGIQRLCEGFGFDELSAGISAFSAWRVSNQAMDADASGAISVLEKKGGQHDRPIGVLEDKFARSAKDFDRFIEDVSALRCAATWTETLSEGIAALKT
jgi:hypothetical protein